MDNFRLKLLEKNPIIVHTILELENTLIISLLMPLETAIFYKLDAQYEN